MPLNSIQDHEPDIPNKFLETVTPRIRTSVFRLIDAQNDFRDKIVAHIEQTRLNLFMRITDEEVVWIMWDMEATTAYRGGDTAFEHLETMFFDDMTGCEAAMLQFVKGYRALILEKVEEYRNELPQDVLRDPVIQRALERLEGLLYSDMYENPLEWFKYVKEIQYENTSRFNLLNTSQQINALVTLGI